MADKSFQPAIESACGDRMMPDSSHDIGSNYCSIQQVLMVDIPCEIPQYNTEPENVLPYQMADQPVVPSILSLKKGELSKKKGSLLTLSTLKTADTETTNSVSPGSDPSYRQAPSSSSSLSCVAPVSSPAKLSTISLKGAFLHLNATEVDGSSNQAAPVTPAKDITNGMEDLPSYSKWSITQEQ